jgi:hypothetical protein
MNRTLNLNFIPVVSSQSAWVAGGTVTLLQKTDCCAFLRYNFRREDDVVKVGFAVDLSVPALK